MKKYPQRHGRVLANLRREEINVSTMMIAMALIEVGFVGILADKVFGVPPAMLAIITAIPALAHLSSLHWARATHGRSKLPFLVAIQISMLAAIGLIAVLPRTGTGAWGLVALVIVARVLATGMVTVRTAIWHMNYPRRIRARIAGRLTLIAQIVTGVISVAAAALLDLNHSSFRIIFPLAAFSGILGISALRRLRMHHESHQLALERSESPREDNATSAAVLARHSGLRQISTVLGRDALFRSYMASQFLSGMGALMLQPVFVHLISRVHDMSYLASTMLVVGIPLICATVTLPVWSAYLDRVHVVRFRCLQNVLLTAAHLVTFIGFYQFSVPVLAIGRILRGLAWGGGVIGWQIGHHDFAPRDRATLYMGVHVTLTGVRGGIAPLIGMALYLGWPAVLIPLTRLSIPGFGGMGESVFLVGFAFAVVAGIGFLSLYLRIHRANGVTTEG